MFVLGGLVFGEAVGVGCLVLDVWCFCVGCLIRV